MSEKGKLFLLPTPLGENVSHTIPEYVVEVMHTLDYFIAERAKTARRFLKDINTPVPFPEMVFFELNKHTLPEEIEKFLDPILDGKNMGLISEAGLPGIADPGAEIVALAHRKDIEVVPFVGPSSIFMALMASGLNGQQFSFCGYLPVKQPARNQTLARLEQHALKTGEAKIFIETPYRNEAFIKDALSTLSNSTTLCIAANISLPTQYINSKTVKEWKNIQMPDLKKKPAIFLIGKSVSGYYRHTK